MNKNQEYKEFYLPMSLALWIVLFQSVLEAAIPKNYHIIAALLAVILIALLSLRSINNSNTNNSKNSNCPNSNNLIKIKHYRDSGLITEGDYEKYKKAILDKTFID